MHDIEKELILNGTAQKKEHYTEDIFEALFSVFYIKLKNSVIYLIPIFQFKNYKSVSM
jgi:hypothetical protein